jgi:hypothetical protein
MITIDARRTLKYKYFNRFSKFVLVGNDIDGSVSVKLEEFKNWEDVKSRLKQIIETITFYGEWNLDFYEVPENYKIKLLYGYYKVPVKGKRLFQLSYDQYIGNIIKLHLDDSMIHFYFLTEEVRLNENAEEHEDYMNVDVYEEFLTILLFNRDVKKRTDPEIYTIDDASYLERRGAASLWFLENGIGENNGVQF